MADKKPIVLIDGDVGGISEGDAIGVIYGGTGATTSVEARANLGLGTMAGQNATSVDITGGVIKGTSISGGFFAVDF